MGWKQNIGTYCQKNTAKIGFIDNFWQAIAGPNIDLNWLLKVRIHLDKIEKEQGKIKWKKLSSLFRPRFLMLPRPLTNFEIKGIIKMKLNLLVFTEKIIYLK